MPMSIDAIIAAALYHDHPHTRTLLIANQSSVEKLLSNIKNCSDKEIQKALSEKIEKYRASYRENKKKTTDVSSTDAILLGNDPYSELQGLNLEFFAQFAQEEESSSGRNIFSIFSKKATHDLFEPPAALFNEGNLSRQAVTCLIFQELPCFVKSEFPRELEKLIDEFDSVIRTNDNEKLQHAKNVLDVLPWKDEPEFNNIKMRLDEALNAAKIASGKRGPTSLTNAPVDTLSEKALSGLLRFASLATGKSTVKIPPDAEEHKAIGRETARTLQKNGHDGNHHDGVDTKSNDVLRVPLL